jgi:hypothetical protein
MSLIVLATNASYQFFNGNTSFARQKGITLQNKTLVVYVLFVKR